MTAGFVVSTIVFGAIAIYGAVELYDFIQVRRGIFPKQSETTLDDIKQLRDKGYDNIAVRRFMKMPENRGLYTSKGADKLVKEL